MTGTSSSESNMNEFVLSVIAILKKGNLIFTLLAVAIAILVYKRYDDWLWAIFSLCITYPILYGLYHLLQVYSYKSRVMYEIDYYEKEQRLRNEVRLQKEIERVRGIYYSLPDNLRQRLKQLCSIPKPNGGSDCTRILNMLDAEHIKIDSACQQISCYHYGLLELESSIESVIVKIDPTLFWVVNEELREKQDSHGNRGSSTSA